jgi:hypothetical protein
MEAVFRDLGLDVNSIDMNTSIACNNTLEESVFCIDTFREGSLGPRGNLEEMVEEADAADNLFVGGKKKLMQWSVSQGKVTKDWGNVMAGDIESMCQTSDKKYLFVSDSSGYLRQINVKEQRVVRNYGQIHANIWSIAITSDDKYLFTSD